MLTPLFIILGAIALGWICDRVVGGWLERWARNTVWQGDDVIIAALRGIIWLWIVLLGAHQAAASSSLPDHVRELVSRGTQAGFILSLTVVVARIATGAFRLHAETIKLKGSVTVVPLLINLVVYSIGALVTLQTEGISITPVLTALGVGGLAVALALQDTLGNLFAGIHILVAGQVRPGDFLRLSAEHEGYVIDIGWRNTSIRTLTNNLVVIPNKKLGESVVTNFSLPEPAMALVVPVSVSYDSDLAEVERVLLAAAAEVVAGVEGALEDPAPVVRFAEFGESGIETRLVIRVHDMETLNLARHLAITVIHRRLREAGIDIAYPTHTVHLRHPLPVAKA